MAIALYAAVCFAAGLAVAFSEASSAPEVLATAEPSAEVVLVDAPVLASPAPGRANYNYSVIPGGARDAQELAHAIQTDSVVADHYRDIDPAAMRPVRVQADRLAYVSYRKNDQVFWTKNKVRIYEGETILTNGEAEIRGRCGNAMSMAPMLPTADDEPDTAVFDALTDVGPKLVAFDLTPWGVPFMAPPAGEVVAPRDSSGFYGPMGVGGGTGGGGGAAGDSPEVMAEGVGISSACAASLARVQRLSADTFTAAAIELADACGPGAETDPSAGDPSTFAATGSTPADPGGDPGDPPLVLQPLLPDDPGGPGDPGDDPPTGLTPDQHLNPTPVPEPATLLLFGSGIAGLLARHRRAQSKKRAAL